ncbi:hypothetical protein HPB52_004816 [Rhipicephalus sanguineus]|uniref:DDE Tnp4 domain-containing protein n=1 Tax=Rhipicephalus sanguineus TaxID=34632 RepID=A0A9D4PBI7_RHISA|nr:hypothetical protein HPB52_004816 [Rhipicephalus sanguineus]
MGSLPAIVQLAMEVVDSDSEDDEYDELLKIALKRARQSRNRVPCYYEDVVNKYIDFEFKRISDFRGARFTHLSPVLKPLLFTQVHQKAGLRSPISDISPVCTFSLADRFDIAESSVQACVDRLLAFLNALCFRRLYIVNANSIKQCCLLVMAACTLHNLRNEERDFFDEFKGATLDDEVGSDEAHIMSDDICSNETLRNFIAQLWDKSLFCRPRSD